jgi:hypothetical protein
MIAVLLGCGLRRAELAAVTLEHLQQREERPGFSLIWSARVGMYGRFRYRHELPRVCNRG